MMATKMLWWAESGRQNVREEFPRLTAGEFAAATRRAQRLVQVDHLDALHARDPLKLFIQRLVMMRAGWRDADWEDADVDEDGANFGQ